MADGMSHDEQLEQARQLVQLMEQGEEDQATEILEKMSKMREHSLFQELGKLTREFHEALNNFRLDSRITTLTQQEIPDARERLNYVISMTEQAANRTMAAVEESVPVCQSLESEAESLKADWDRFVRRELDADQFRELSHRIASFLGSVSTETPRIRANFNEVLMAQDFQDLTGQIIRRVITLVDDLEGNLVELVRISGESLIDRETDEKPEKVQKEGDITAAGPPVPGVDSGTVSGQDEVDDLLSSLGF